MAQFVHYASHDPYAPRAIPKQLSYHSNPDHGPSALPKQPSQQSLISHRSSLSGPTTVTINDDCYETPPLPEDPVPAHDVYSTNNRPSTSENRLNHIYHASQGVNDHDALRTFVSQKYECDSHSSEDAECEVPFDIDIGDNERGHRRRESENIRIKTERNAMKRQMKALGGQVSPDLSMLNLSLLQLFSY